MLICLSADARIRKLLEYSATIPPRVLIPAQPEEAAVLIEQNPFGFALAAVLDRGTKAELIWTIPFFLQRELGHLDPGRLARMSTEDLLQVFRRLPAKPRYITDAPRTVRELSEVVLREYGGDVTRIWNGRSSAYTKSAFRRIYGVGPGIASMIVLLLERCFHVRFTDIDHREMDVKPDVHVVRVFKRLGFISQENADQALEAARRLYPEYPGALDAPAWRIGKKWCFPSSPDCLHGPMNEVCPKQI